MNSNKIAQQADSGNNCYLAFPKQDESGIAVTLLSHEMTVQSHCHEFQEFALITKGYCIHKYKGVEVPLMPGDVFLIKPHTPHSYLIQSPIELIYCQFYPEKLNVPLHDLLLEVEDGCNGRRDRAS